MHFTLVTLNDGKLKKIMVQQLKFIFNDIIVMLQYMVAGLYVVFGENVRHHVVKE
jgi:hypothetical protein